MNKIYDILFVDNFNLPGFFLMIGTVIVFSIIINKNQNKYSRWFLLIFSTVFSLTVLFRTTSLEKEDYKTFKIFHDTGCLYETYDVVDVGVSDEYSNRIILMHYFDNGKKKLLICDTLEHKDELIDWMRELCPVVEVDYDKNLNIKFSKEELETLKDNTNRIRFEDKRFIIDNSWDESNNIIVFTMDEKEYFISEDLFNDLNQGTYQNNYLPEKYIDMHGYECLSELRGEKNFYQLIVLVVMFLSGYLFCKVIFGERYDFLAAFMAVPVSTAVYCTLTIIAILIGIPINTIYTSLCVIAMIGISIYFLVQKKEVFDLRHFIICLTVATAVIFFFVYSKLWILATDGYAKTFYGVMLSSYSLDKQEILSFMPFGMFDPIINNIGWNFHVDFLYALYPIWRICGIGVITYLYFSFVERTKYNVALYIVAIFFFITNIDILFNTFFVLSNGMVGCMTLLLIVAVLFKIKLGKKTDVIIYSMVMGIITTRVEGTCYVCLLMALFCGMVSYRENLKKINFLVSLEMIFWQGGLMLFSEENSIFWNQKKGVMLIGAAIALMALPYIMGTTASLVNFIRKYYYVISIILLFTVCIVLLMWGPEMAYPTAQIFAKHFATSYVSNSGAFWSFVVFTIPLIQTRKSETAKLILAIIIDYLLLTYMIFCFRTGVPIHTCENDSCRRVIQQIMPIVLLATLYISSEKKINKEALC